MEEPEGDSGKGQRLEEQQQLEACALAQGIRLGASVSTYPGDPGRLKILLMALALLDTGFKLGCGRRADAKRDWQGPDFSITLLTST